MSSDHSELKYIRYSTKVIPPHFVAVETADSTSHRSPPPLVPPSSSSSSVVFMSDEGE